MIHGLSHSISQYIVLPFDGIQVTIHSKQAQSSHYENSKMLLSQIHQVRISINPFCALLKHFFTSI